MTWGLVGAAAVTVVGSALTSDSGGGGGGGGGGSSVYDPYAQYRPAAAQQLNDLMKDPSSAVNSSYGQAMQLAASRTMAAQGYTGSGNALVAAANAGGQAYQQQFNNLAMLSGAGQSPATAQSAADAQNNFNTQQNNQMWGQIGGLVGKGISAYNNSGSSSAPAVSDWGSSASALQQQNANGPTSGGGILV